MSRRYMALVRNILPITVVWLALPAAAVEVDTSELARCTAVVGTNERLACYDALAASVPPGATSAPAAPTPPVALVPAPGAPAAAIQTSPAAHSFNSDDPANFGL